MPPSPFGASSFSRRRALALAGGAALAAGAAGRRAAAQDTPVASPVPSGPPVAGLPAATGQPMPSTLAVDASPAFRAVAEALVAAMRQFQVPGAAIGLLIGDREEHATFGRASLSSLRPVTPETLFQIGSLSKTYTATATWRLIDEGALALDAPVRTYIPELTLMDADVAARVTVRNLLDHTAGWSGDEGFNTGDDDGAIARYVAERLPRLPQVFPLGAFFSYNNAALTLLGRLIEVTTGTTYNAAMERLLLGPLGLDDSLLDHAAVRRRPFADGHMAVPVNGRPVVAVQTPLWLPRAVDPAGGIWSTTRDVIRYARFHMDRATVPGAANVVSPDSLARMREPAVDVPGLSLQMGMDWFVQDIDGRRAFFHNGDTLGQHAELVAIPEQGFALAVLTNGQGGGGVAAMMALDAALGQVPELASLAGKVGLLHAVIVPADVPTVDLAPALVAEYPGRYAVLGSDQAYTVVQTGEGLELTIATVEEPGAWLSTILPPPSPPAPVAFLAEDLAVANQQRLPFVRDPEGRVRWIGASLRLLPHADGDA